MKFLIPAFLLLLVACGKGNQPLSSDQKATTSQFVTNLLRVTNGIGHYSPNKPQSSSSGGGQARQEKTFENELSKYKCAVTKDNENLVLSIKGRECPIEFEMTLTETEFSFRYKLTNSELAPLTDIIEFEFNFSIPKKGKFEAMSGEARVVSQSEGTVDIEFEAAQDEERITTSTTYEFPHFRVVLEAEKTKEGTTYLINGEKVSYSEYKKLEAGGYQF